MKALLPTVALLLLASPGGKYKLQTLKESAPEGVAQALRAELQVEGLRVSDAEGKPHLDLWLRKEVPTVEAEDEPGIVFDQIRDCVFFGILRVHKKIKDYKGKNLYPGTYTLRRSVFPEDGDHMGVADTRDFLLASPVALDVKPAPLTIDELEKLSTKASKTKHPSVLYLRKASDEKKPLPRLAEDEAAESWLLECEVKTSGALKKPLRFGIVFEGISPAM